MCPLTNEAPPLVMQIPARETARAKVGRRLPLLLCALCEASWGEACLLARKDAARAQE